MNSYRYASVIRTCFIVVIAGFISGIQGQTVEEEYLAPHNEARAALNEGIPDLVWDTTLEAYAADWAATQTSGENGCSALVHSGGPYGENLYSSSGPATPADAVALWVDEQAYYDYDSNSCLDGKTCGHYTQVVWRNTESVGCAAATCPDGEGTFVICSYDPRGNFNGEQPY